MADPSRSCGLEHHAERSLSPRVAMNAGDRCAADKKGESSDENFHEASVRLLKAVDT
jgi:hypothetical protein